MVFQLHYKPKKISKIVASDRRVAVVGKVHSVSSGSFILEDESGKIEIFGKEIELKEGGVVRVFCSIEGDRLKADVIQNLENFDVELFKKVEELYIKAGF